MLINVFRKTLKRFFINIVSFLLLLLFVYACYYYRPGLSEYRFNNSFFHSFIIIVKSQLGSLTSELTSQGEVASERNNPAMNGKGILVNLTTIKVTEYPFSLDDKLFQANIRLWYSDNSLGMCKIRDTGLDNTIHLGKEMPDSLLNHVLGFNISPVNYDRVSKSLISSLKRSSVLVIGTLVLVFFIAMFFVWLDQSFPYNQPVNVTIRSLNLFSGIHLIVWSVIVVVLTKHFMNFSVWMIVILAFGSGMFSDFFNSLKDAFKRLLKQDYLLAVRARGGSLVKNFYKEILIIFVTLITAKLPAIISGTIIVEYSFSYEGLGLRILNGINHPEENAVNVILGVTILVGIVVILTNSFSALAQQILDPRLNRN